MWLFFYYGFIALSFILPIILSECEEKSGKKTDGQSLSIDKTTIFFIWSDSNVLQIVATFALAVRVIC